VESLKAETWPNSGQADQSRPFPARHRHRPLRFIAMSPERGSPAGRLLDRTTELGVITAAVRSAVSGSGSVLLVEGVAGIGKTSLLRPAGEQAALAGMTVRAARAARGSCRRGA
jgi:hypothetical protein